MGRSKTARTREWLTLVAVGAWLGSLVVRTMNPDTVATFVSIDPIILLIVGYWFSRVRDKNGDGS